MAFNVDKSEYLKEFTTDKLAELNIDKNAVLQMYKDPFADGNGRKELTKDDLLFYVIKCANFCAKKHSTQRRKDPEKTPYINHPIGNKINRKTNLNL